MGSDLSGRVALVTGGSQGIGLAAATALAKAGADISICARNVETLQKAADEIRTATDRQCLPVAADLSSLEECQRFVQTATGHFGRADILVCSANMPRTGGGPFLSMPDERWVYHINVKFLSAVRCAREVIPHMQANRWGRIVLVGGMATRGVQANAMDNGPVCAALSNFAKQLAAQLIKDGIRVNTVLPGSTFSPAHLANLAEQAARRGITLEEMEREAAEALPLGRILDSEEIASLITFLASDAANTITGQSIAIDGGSSTGVFY